MSTIEYNLPKGSDVTLIVYDILGREITTLVDRHIQAGTHEGVWDAGFLPSGIYIALLVTPEYTKSIKMVLLK